jgi:hypothetical protein
MKSFRQYAVVAALTFATAAVGAAPAFAAGNGNADTASSTHVVRAKPRTAQPYYNYVAPAQDPNADNQATQWPSGFKDLH